MKKIALIVLAFFALIQLIRIDRFVPKIDYGKDFISDKEIPKEVREIVKRSCYDCHSFETKYPWYTNVAPVSWWIKDHINDAREYINFSNWEDYSAEEKSRKLMNSVAYIKPNMMPLSSYVSQHPEARLSTDDKKVLNKWMEKEAKKLNPNLKLEE